MSYVPDIPMADLIVEVVPFSSELKLWCRSHQNVMEAFKFANPDGFLPIGATFTTCPSTYPQHQVIGFLVYDRKTCKFKQDYILNIKTEGKEFILYTKVPGSHQDDKEVKHIKEFFARYDPDGGYRREHHLTLEEVEARAHDKPFLSRMARRIVQIADAGPQRPTKTQIAEARRKVLELKQFQNTDS